MRFPLKSNRGKDKNRRVRFAVIVSVAFLLIGILIARFVPKTDGIMYTLGYPLWKTSSGISYLFHDSLTLLSSKQALIDHAVELTKQNNDLNLKVLNRDVLEAENQSLREILGRIPEDKKYVYASVVAKPGFLTYDSLILDAGTREGVTEGALVFSTGLAPLGRVVSVLDTSSRVTLFSNPDQETPVIIGTSSTTPGTALGRGGGNFTIKIPRSIKLLIHDPIRFASSENLILGEIEKITTDPADSFQEVLFTLPVNIQHVSAVLIEHNAQD